jgi:hypothetical protein
MRPARARIRTLAVRRCKWVPRPGTLWALSLPTPRPYTILANACHCGDTEQPTLPRKAFTQVFLPNRQYTTSKATVNTRQARNERLPRKRHCWARRMSLAPERKSPFISFHFFFRIGAFQWVTADSNKKTFSFFDSLIRASRAESDQSQLILNSIKSRFALDNVG